MSRADSFDRADLHIRVLDIEIHDVHMRKIARQHLRALGWKNDDVDHFLGGPREDKERPRARLDQGDDDDDEGTDAFTPTTFELTVLNGGASIFTATWPEESAAASGPHRGKSLVGRGIFDDVSEGKTYKELGLPHPLVAWQADGSVVPAVDEYRTVVAAAKQGSALAREALKSLGRRHQEDVD